MRNILFELVLRIDSKFIRFNTYMSGLISEKVISSQPEIHQL